MSVNRIKAIIRHIVEMGAGTGKAAGSRHEWDQFWISWSGSSTREYSIWQLDAVAGIIVKGFAPSPRIAARGFPSSWQNG